jgi:hypothetical protein
MLYLPYNNRFIFCTSTKYYISLELSFHDDSDDIQYLMIGALVGALHHFKVDPMKKLSILLKSGKILIPKIFYRFDVANGTELITVSSRTLSIFLVRFILPQLF